MSMIGLYSRGIRISIRDNSAAYGYSVLITACLATLNNIAGTPSVPALFLFAIGAASAFTVLEALASNFFRVRIRGEPSDVVVLGSAFSAVSISAGLAAAVLIGLLWQSWVAWLLGPFFATTAYILGVGFQLSVAIRAEERSGESETA